MQIKISSAESIHNTVPQNALTQNFFNLIIFFLNRDSGYSEKFHDIVVPNTFRDQTPVTRISPCRFFLTERDCKLEE